MQLLIGGMLGLMLLGMPIAYALGLSSLIYVVTCTDLSPMVIAQRVCVGADSLVLLALPFFLLAGEIMNAAGITHRLTRLALAIIGPPRGGLSYVVVAVNVLVAMVSGAAVASAAAVGSTMVPMMVKQGYPRSYAAALNAASATMGPIIPPSVGFIIYASVSGASVGKLFLAGTIPGVLLALGAWAVCAWMAYSHGYPAGERHSRRELWESFREALPALLMPVIILGGIFGGLVTPTEAGALAVGYGLLVGFVIYRSLRFGDLIRILTVTARRTASIMMIIACASCFGFLISHAVDAERIIGSVQAMTGSRTALLLLLIGLILILGMFMEGGSIMIILTPLILPMLSAYQIDAVHFGVVFQLAIMIGLLTPPVGMLLFVLAGISRVPVKTLVRALWPFYVMLLILLLLVAFVPELSLWLTQQTGGALK
ncbi:MAG TPA: TRAP transporter large permease [Kiritimatiellia bacterium]|nr:TRAP transporter large permease [Kiritimatiellia bacterium]HRU69995.1 TRAP transporter large permease [Kiritimatiellia bacterium]